MQQPAAVAAPDRAPDAEQAPPGITQPAQQQPEVSAAEQPAVIASPEAAPAAATPAFDAPKLATLPLQAIINTQVCDVILGIWDMGA